MSFDFERTWIRARNSGVPIIAIECADPVQVGPLICKDTSPVFAWDIVRGVYPIDDEDSTLGKFGNNSGAKLLDSFGQEDRLLIAEPVTLIDYLRAKTKQVDTEEEREQDELAYTTVIMLGAHKLLQSNSDNRQDSAKIIQALYNLRDTFKAARNTLVLLGPSFQLPAELVNDIYVISYPLPTDTERSKVITDLCTSIAEENGGVRFAEEQIVKAMSATRGLTPFATEQAVVLSASKKGINTDTVRQWWKKTIDAQRGLSVVQTTLTLDDIAGLDNFKRFARMVVGSKDGPEAIIWIDEIEKALAGAAGDNTGTTQDILGQILTHMQETNADGLIAAGGPGTGKSLSSVALGSVNNLPVISLDLGGLKAGILGETEGYIRAALKTIRGLAGRTFWIASCNSLAAIRPELKRRFTYGIWYFDLPDDVEGPALWAMYTKKYGLKNTPPKGVDGWTGAEIHVCCRTAQRLGISLEEASQWIVPVRETAKAEIELLREQANGRYTSATNPGPYSRQVVKKPKTARSVTLS